MDEPLGLSSAVIWQRCRVHPESRMMSSQIFRKRIHGPGIVTYSKAPTFIRQLATLAILCRTALDYIQDLEAVPS